MEDKKTHPSLPSNYVTLAQLQERWLKEQHRKQNEKLLQEQQQQQDQHQPRDRVVALQTHRTASKSAPRNHRAKQFRPKIRNDSGSNGPAIEVNSEDSRKLEANAGIGDENTGLDSKDNKSKEEEKVKRKPRVDKDGRGPTEGAAQAQAQTTMEGSKEAENSEAKRGDDEKATIKNELDDKSGDSTIEVEKKFGALSVNSGSGKQNGRLRRVHDGFHHSQSRRNYGGRGYGHGPFGGGFHRQRREVQKPRSDKLIWVRKDGNVGGIETSSGSNT